jgi:GntR family transcriptional regulator, histidine utilization repressor
MVNSNIVPLYKKVKTDILSNIQSGQLKSGDRVSSENELVEQFSVSRMTANRALRELTDEGYLVRVPGVGTFVGEPVVKSQFLQINNLAGEVRERGHQYSAKIVKKKNEKASLDIAEKLGVPVGSAVYHLIIIHYEQKIAVQLEDRYFLPEIVPKFEETDFTEITPYEYLMQVEPTIENVEHIVSAVKTDEKIAKLLTMPKDEPCLLLKRRTWVRGRIVTAASLYHPGTRYQLSGTFSP